MASQPGVVAPADFSNFSLSLIAHCVSTRSCAGAGLQDSRIRSRALCLANPRAQLFHASFSTDSKSHNAFSARFAPQVHSHEPDCNNFSHSTTTSSRVSKSTCPICDLPCVSLCQCCAELFCARHIYACSDCCVNLCGSCLDAHSLESHRSVAQCCDRNAHSLESHRSIAHCCDRNAHSLESHRAPANEPAGSTDQTAAVPERCDSTDRSTHSDLLPRTKNQPQELFVSSAEAAQ